MLSGLPLSAKSRHYESSTKYHFHGIFAPNCEHCSKVVSLRPQGAVDTDKSRAHMIWAQRLKRVFNIDIETCSECGGAVRVIASIEDPLVIRKILAYLDDNATAVQLPQCRAPPAIGPPMGLLL